LRRRRTRTPSPASWRERNSTPARSNARRIAATVLVRESTAPCSNRVTELRDMTARSANLWRVHPRRARAARTSRGVTIPRGKPKPGNCYHRMGFFYPLTAVRSRFLAQYLCSGVFGGIPNRPRRASPNAWLSLTGSAKGRDGCERASLASVPGVRPSRGRRPKARIAAAQHSRRGRSCIQLVAKLIQDCGRA